MSSLHRIIKSRQKNRQKLEAKQHLVELFNQAEIVFSKNQTLAHRYVTLARNIAMKFKLRLPLELKRKFCQHCYYFLMPGINSRVRTREGKVVISCLECKKFMRIPTKRKQPSLTVNRNQKNVIK